MVNNWLSGELSHKEPRRLFGGATCRSQPIIEHKGWRWNGAVPLASNFAEPHVAISESVNLDPLAVFEVHEEPRHDQESSRHAESDILSSSIFAGNHAGDLGFVVGDLCLEAGTGALLVTGLI